MFSSVSDSVGEAASAVGCTVLVYGFKSCPSLKGLSLLGSFIIPMCTDMALEEKHLYF